MFQDMMDSIGFLGTKDAELAQAMQNELQRQRDNIEFTIKVVLYECKGGKSQS